MREGAIHERLHSIHLQRQERAAAARERSLRIPGGVGSVPLSAERRAQVAAAHYAQAAARQARLERRVLSQQQLEHVLLDERRRADQREPNFDFERATRIKWLDAT